MAIAPLQLPGYAAPQSLDLATSLSQLGQQYKQAQQDALVKNTLASLGQNGNGQIDPSALIGSGNMSLAQLGLQIQNRQQDQARQERQDQRQLSRDAVDDRFRQQSLALQQRAAARADQTPEQAAAERAKAAAAYGLDPNSPRGQAFALTGKIPEADTTVTSQIEQRKKAAAAAGLTPDNPAYNSYTLTGKMPREDAQPLTATDKKAILEADEHVLNTQQTIDNLKTMQGLSKKAYEGPTAGIRGYVGSLVGTEAGEATANLQNLSTANALSQLKSTFGAAPTEGERKILLDIQGSANQPDSVRQEIYARAEKAAQRRLEFNKQRADELRGGQFYKPQGNRQTPPGAPQAPSSPQGTTSSGIQWSVQ